MSPGRSLKSDDSSLQRVTDFLSTLCARDTTAQNKNNNNKMRRASASRRAEHLQSPGMRSRSSERGLEEEDEEFAEKATFNRAFSDPFDDAMQHQETASTTTTTDDDEDSLFAADSNALPTLPRYPVTETHDKNCWSEPEVSKFSVRGANYLEDKVKQKSAAYLLQARGSDIFLTDKKDVTIEKMRHKILGGQLRKKPTLAFNFCFPWGFMNLYFEVPSTLAVYLQPNPPVVDPELSIAEKTLAMWLLGDDEYKNERLKLIPYVPQGPWAARNMVTGKPAIIGKKLPISYEVCHGRKSGQQTLLTATLDIGSSSATAKRIVSVCRRYMSVLTLDIGFVIQGESEEELPEQMLGGIRVHGPDPLKAPKLS